MLITCLAFTKQIKPWQIEAALQSFNDQSYQDKQLIIINNHDTNRECQQLEIIYNYNITIIDRPGYSNGKALLEGLQLGAGQVIAHFPLDHIHHSNRLEWCLDDLVKSKSTIIAPSRKWKWTNGPEIITEESNIIPELAFFKSPAYTDDYEIDYGAWWQYPLLAHEQGIDIIEIDKLLAIELPSEKPTDKNYYAFLAQSMNVYR